MKNNNVFLLIIVSIFIYISCNKEADNLMEYAPTITKYTLIDSIVKIVNSIDTTTTTTSYSINREIDIFLPFTKDYLVYNSDTLLHNVSSSSYTLNGDSLSINLKSDSIFIQQKTDSMGIATLINMNGIQKK